MLTMRKLKKTLFFYKDLILCDKMLRKCYHHLHFSFQRMLKRFTTITRIGDEAARIINLANERFKIFVSRT